MLRALKEFLRRRQPPQLELALEEPPRTAAELLERLRALGMGDAIEQLRLTRNRTVMVSFGGRELRIHEGYLAAPTPVLRAVITFVRGRTRAERAAARSAILAFRIERPTVVRRPLRTAPDDIALATELGVWHARYNELHFGGRLRPIAIRVSRRMKSRLGHYTAASLTGEPAEIAVSRGHIQRHGWAEARHTLLHEMVHQWQDESGHPIDHGATFRAMARAVGITPSARRAVVTRGRRGPPAQRPDPFTIDLRAAREG